MKVLIVTSEWPSAGREADVPFLVEQVAELRRAQADVTVFAFRGKTNPFRYVAAWLRLRSLHRLGDFDVVHAHFGQSGLVALPCPVPLIVTFHGSDLLGVESDGGKQTLRGRMLRQVSRFVARHADSRIVVSSRLVNSLPPGLGADVIPCGIDVQKFQPIPRKQARDELGFDQAEALVLFVGNPQNPIKNVQLAEQAVEELDDAFSARLVVLHGQPHERVKLYMSACDVMVMTSYHEGSPTVVKEAVACNLPVVAVPVGDVSELISGVDGCSVVGSRSPSEIAAALEGAIHLTGVISGRQAAELFDHSVITPQIMGVYEGAVGLR